MTRRSPGAIWRDDKFLLGWAALGLGCAIACGVGLWTGDNNLAAFGMVPVGMIFIFGF